MNLKLKKLEALILFGSVLVGVLIFVLKPHYYTSDLRLIPVIAVLIISTILSSLYIDNPQSLAILPITSFMSSYAFYHASNGRLFLLLPIPLYLSACLLFRRVRFLPSSLFFLSSLQIFIITYNQLRIRDRTLLMADILYLLFFILLLTYRHCVVRSTTSLLRVIRTALVVILLVISWFTFIYSLFLLLLPFSVDICRAYADARANPLLYDLPSYADGSILFRSCYAKIILPHALNLSMPNLQYGDLTSGAFTLSPHNPLLEYMRESSAPIFTLLLFTFLSLYTFSVSSKLSVVLLSVSSQSKRFVSAAALMYALFASSTLFATYPMNLTRTFLLFLSLLLSAAFLNLHKFLCTDS